MSDVASTRSFVFYGQAGHGKTTLAGTAPGPILLCDIRDRGTDSVSDVKDMDVMEIEEWADMERVYWYLKKHPKEYRSVIWDTASQLQGLAIEQVLAEKGKSATADDITWGTMTQKEWGEVAGMMRPMITNFRDLGLNSIFIAQHRVSNVLTEEDESTNSSLLTPEVGPALMPSVAKHLNASVSVIGNCFIRSRIEEKVVKVPSKNKRLKPKEKIEEIEHIEYCLRIGPNPIYTTKARKSRSIILPDVIVDPTYEKILKVLKGV